MTKILPVGDVLGFDAAGKFINPCSLKNIVSPWSDVIDDVKQVYLERMGENLHSVYVRGSIPRGTAVSGVSDVDTFAIITGDRWQHDLSWIAEAEQKLSKQYPFQTGVEMQLITLNELHEGKDIESIRFTIKILSTCVWGQDIRRLIPSYKLGRYLIKDSLRLEKEINEVTQALSKEQSGETVEMLCRWIMKVIIRAGHSLVIFKEGSYSRDLFPCYTGFCKHYPERAEEMKYALELAIEPIKDQQALLRFLKMFGSWLIAEILEIYPTNEKTYS